MYEFAALIAIFAVAAFFCGMGVDLIVHFHKKRGWKYLCAGGVLIAIGFLGILLTAFHIESTMDAMHAFVGALS